MSEISSPSFYNHQGYVRSYYAFYRVLEKWLGNIIFRQDLSRVYFASDSQAYRRRFELTDASAEYESLSASSLQFPFANYVINGGWKPDTRAGANTAAQLYLGVIARSRMLRTMSVQGQLSVTFHFDREDDSRYAYDALMWRSYREFYFTIEQEWYGEQVSVPVFLKVLDLEYAPGFEQADWLEKNRIFTIKATIAARSFIVEPPPQTAYTQGTTPWSNDERYPLTEEVVLELMNENNILSEFAIDSLFNENPEIIVDHFGVLESSSTNTVVSWQVSATADTSITGYQLQLSTGEVVNLPPDASTHSFTQLEPQSTFIANLTIFSDTGPAKVIPLQFTTVLDPEQAVGDTNDLVGTSW